MEEELESEDPMELGDDVDSLEDEGDEGSTVTFVEHRTPMAMPVGGGCGIETRGDAPDQGNALWARMPPANGR